jgi:hypothetical protein
MRQGRKESTAVALRLKPKSTYMWIQFMLMVSIYVGGCIDMNCKVHLIIHQKCYWWLGFCGI